MVDLCEVKAVTHFGWTVWARVAIVDKAVWMGGSSSARDMSCTLGARLLCDLGKVCRLTFGGCIVL